MNESEILKKLKVFNLDGFGHGDIKLIDHLKGTSKILKNWLCREDLCVAGLVHSIYGTESYNNKPIDLKYREQIESVIGIKAENLAYMFGAHIKSSLWLNLKRVDNYKITDRLVGKDLLLNKRQLTDLMTLTLANWLEQRPRVEEKYKFNRKIEFTDAKRFLPVLAYDDFKKAYSL
jgi:hypothetical protein